MTDHFYLVVEPLGPCVGQGSFETGQNVFRLPRPLTRGIVIRMPKLSRRKLIVGGTVVLLTSAGGRVVHQAVGRAPSEHNHYFQRISSALDAADTPRPVLVIDRDRARANLERLLTRIRPRYHYRIVVKSLPSLPLLAWLMEEADTRRLMIFNEPFLRAVTAAFPESDVLMGKPLTVDAAAHYYRHRDAASGFRPDRQLQWLIDSPERLAAYGKLADGLKETVRVSVEINVGLHRGGVKEQSTLAEMISEIKRHPYLSFGGLMGYEAHIAKAPGGPERNFRRAMNRYASFLETVRDVLGEHDDEWVLNAGGSTTYTLYEGRDVVPNELAVGSAIVQPTDFDLPTLSDHEPASFIATHALKVNPGLHLPGVPELGRILGWWDQRYRTTLFIDGGNWMGEPVSPPGLVYNNLYGRSSNQEMLNGPAELNLVPGDRVFLRPTQSEAVLLQFGDLLMYDPEAGAIVDRWAPFRL